jgi:pimeloyl-ACP methyl ester carboxylesterase
MLRPKDAPPFFASTVLLDPLKSLKRLDVPVLILDATGSHENYRDTTPTEHNERLQKLHPDWIEHTQVPTGHFVHREAPDLFITAMEKFHQRLGQSRR